MADDTMLSTVVSSGAGKGSAVCSATAMTAEVACVANAAARVCTPGETSAGTLTMELTRSSDWAMVAVDGDTVVLLNGKEEEGNKNSQHNSDTPPTKRNKRN